MPLSVEDYVRHELAALQRTPNRIIEACRPDVFLQVGYPTSVETDAALERYVDVMHELRHSLDYANLLGGLTHEEFELFKEVSEATASFAEKNFGRSIIPKGALVRAMITYRHIRSLAPPETTTVCEIGPGSGYLGALLASAGYRYVANDVTQAFYLYQSRLWEHMFGARFIELATDPREFAEFGELDPGAVVHVPWWKFTVVAPQKISPHIDIVTCNHALCEMHRSALHYLVALCRPWLARPGRVRFFFAEGMGSEIARHRSAAYSVFDAGNFIHAHSDGMIDVFVPAEHRDALYDVAAEPVSKEIAAPPEASARTDRRPSQGEPGSTVSRILLLANPKFTVHLIRRTINVLTGPNGWSEFVAKFANFLHGRPPAANGVDPAVADARRNVVTQRIEDGRASIQTADRMTDEELIRFQQGLLGQEDLRTDDERFFQFCFGKDYYS